MWMPLRATWKSQKTDHHGVAWGLLTFRSQDLDQARNTLNQMALAFADAMNTQHRAGFDANGDAGGKLFDFGSPAVLSNGKTPEARPLRPR